MTKQTKGIKQIIIELSILIGIALVAFFILDKATGIFKTDCTYPDPLAMPTPQVSMNPYLFETIEKKIVRLAKDSEVLPEIALRIARVESNLDQYAINCNTNGTNDVGIYQINDIHGVSNECRLDAECNIKWAMEEMSENGFGAWYSSEHKWK